VTDLTSFLTPCQDECTVKTLHLVKRVDFMTYLILYFNMLFVQLLFHLNNFVLKNISLKFQRALS
jgi:hypothetical protein